MLSGSVAVSLAGVASLEADEAAATAVDLDDDFFLRFLSIPAFLAPLSFSPPPADVYSDEGMTGVKEGRFGDDGGDALAGGQLATTALPGTITRGTEADSNGLSIYEWTVLLAIYREGADGKIMVARKTATRVFAAWAAVEQSSTKRIITALARQSSTPAAAQRWNSTALMNQP